MFLLLTLIFTIIPIAELYILIKVGQQIGALSTIFIVLFIGMLGAFLARIEGLRVLYGFQRELQEGRMPTGKLLDGLLIFMGAVLLITPGFLTDILGMILIIPFTRVLVKILVKKYLQHMIDKKQGVVIIKDYRVEKDKQ